MCCRGSGNTIKLVTSIISRPCRQRRGAFGYCVQRAPSSLRWQCSRHAYSPFQDLNLPSLPSLQMPGCWPVWWICGKHQQQTSAEGRLRRGQLTPVNTTTTAGTAPRNVQLQCLNVMEGCSEASVQALGVVLQHPQVSSNTRVICTCLQACKSWRAEVQRQVVASIDVRQDDAAGPGITSMAAWVHNNPGLVCSLLVNSRWGGRRREPLQDLAELSIRSALCVGQPDRCSIARSTSAPDLATTASGGTQAATPALLLRSYESNLAASSAILAALPPVSLTRLSLGLTLQTKSGVTAINRLTNLRQLKLGPAPGVDAWRPDFHYGLQLPVPDVSNLLDLRCLELQGVDLWRTVSEIPVEPEHDWSVLAGHGNLLRLPQQLQELNIEVTSGPRWCLCGNCPVFIELEHMQHMQQLKLISLSADLHPHSSLPTSLQGLSVWYGSVPSAHRHHLHVSNLPNLQELQLYNCLDNAEGFRLVAQLPQLQHVELWINLGVPKNAQAWASVPHLRDLTLSLSPSIWLDELTLWQLLSHVAAVTQLTRLCFEVSIVLPSEQPLPENSKFNLCERLNMMTRLQSLQLSNTSDIVDIDFCDIMQLTALEDLGSLWVTLGRRVVSDEAVVSLGRYLPKLGPFGLYVSQP